MFSHVNYSKLKTNLKVTVQRLKLLEKKKTENAKKSSKEIADYLTISKFL
jgi:vacuolar protein sorting-associated protein IST1